jgi:hypothetical protein
VEKMALGVIGVPLKLGRFNAIQCHWYDTKHWIPQVVAARLALAEEKYEKWKE